MCGRFNIVSDPKAWLETFDVAVASDVFGAFEPRYNISPSEPPLPEGSKRATPRRITRIPAIYWEDGQLVADSLLWPLVPIWAKGEVPNYNTANARSEEMSKKPAYRNAWKHNQRCLIFATGFFEWQAAPGKNTKQPWHIGLRDQPHLIFGGLWETSTAPDGSPVRSCTIVTLAANALLRDIHNAGRNKHRMPLILPDQAQRTWLTGSRDAAESLIQPYKDDEMDAWPISTAINNPNSNDARVLEKIDIRI